MQRAIDDAIELTRSLMSEHDESGHGLEHCKQVLDNATAGLDTYPHPLTNIQKLCVKLAALLHDVDDRKLFDTVDYANARGILHQVLPIEYYEEAMNLTIEMIKLVSCSSNGNSTVTQGEEWKLIPRDADRVEAIGEIGLLRAYLYTIHVGRPVVLPDTVRVTTEEELMKVASSDRFTSYLRVKESRSMIDHIYDKMLHICGMQSGSTYLEELAASRKQCMIDFVLEYGRTGVVPPIPGA